MHASEDQVWLDAALQRDFLAVLDMLGFGCTAFMPAILKRCFLACSGYTLPSYTCSCVMLTTNMCMLLCLQAERANGISQSQGMGSKVNYQVADALHQPFRDGQFDLIWSMESGEHMPDKAQFINELTRVCKPGGKILIVTWCHRCATCTLCVSLVRFLHGPATRKPVGYAVSTIVLV